jgi:hypothetical protein
MDAKSIVVDAPFRLLGHLDLRDQITGCRIRSRELDASGFADKTAPAVAPDKIFRPERLTIAQLDITARVVLRKLVTSVPRYMGTDSSSTQPARMRSMWF